MAQMSIVDLIEDDLGRAEWRGKRPYWFCPFHADKKTPSLVVTPDGAHYKCFGCGKSGDDIDWLREVRKMSFADAYRLARGDDPPSRSGGRRKRARKKPQPSPVVQTGKPVPPDGWQEQARVFADFCHEQLFADVGRVALDYLHGRGLRDETIRQWGLGYHEKDRWRDPSKWGMDGGKKVWLARGVVIPWLVGGAVQYVKVRRFGADGPLTDAGEKYAQVRDGCPTLYGLDLLTGKRAVAICEAELDAPLLWQEAGDLVDVVAIGSKGSRLTISYLARLLGAVRWLVALDADADAEAAIWTKYSKRARRMKPLQGNDVTDFYQAGGDLRAWVMFHLNLSN